MKERVETHADDARMSKDLATIYRDVTLDKQLEDVAFGGLQAETAGPALAKLEFKSLLERLSFSGEVGSTGVDVEEAAADVTVLDEQRISELVEVLDHVDVLHVETHGDNPHHADIVGLIFAATGQQFFMTLDVLQSDTATPIREWLADPERKNAVMICIVRIWLYTGMELSLQVPSLMCNWQGTCWTQLMQTRH